MPFRLEMTQILPRLELRIINIVHLGQGLPQEGNPHLVSGFVLLLQSNWLIYWSILATTVVVRAMSVSRIFD